MRFASSISTAGDADEATEEILDLDEISTLSIDIDTRLEDMIGEFQSVSPSLCRGLPR